VIEKAPAKGGNGGANLSGAGAEEKGLPVGRQRGRELRKIMGST